MARIGIPYYSKITSDGKKRSSFEKRARTLSDGQKGPGRNRIGRENTRFGRKNTLLGRRPWNPRFHHRKKRRSRVKKGQAL